MLSHMSFFCGPSHHHLKTSLAALFRVICSLLVSLWAASSHTAQPELMWSDQTLRCYLKNVFRSKLCTLSNYFCHFHHHFIQICNMNYGWFKYHGLMVNRYWRIFIFGWTAKISKYDFSVMNVEVIMADWVILRFWKSRSGCTAVVHKIDYFGSKCMYSSNKQRKTSTSLVRKWKEE